MSTLAPADLAALRRWRTSVLVVFALAGVGVASWLSRLPSVRDDLGATTLAMGVLALGISVGSVAGFAVASRIAVRHSPRLVIRVSLGVAMAGLLLAALSGGALPDYPLAMVGLTLLGLGNGTCNVTMNVEGAAIERALRRPVMPWFHALFSIGAAAGASLGALAATLGISPSVHIPVVVAAMAVTMLVATRDLGTEPHARPAPRPVGAAPDSASRAPRRSPWLEGGTLLIGLIVVGMSFANGAANDWIALAMVDGHGAGPGVAALAVDVFAIAIVVARLCGVAVLSRLGRVRTVRVTALVAVAGLLIFILVPSPQLAFLGAALWGLGVALGFPIGMSAAGDEAEGATGRIAVVAAIGYAGSLVGPPLIGFVAGGVGIRMALLIVLVLVVAAGAAAPILARSRRGAPAAD